MNRRSDVETYTNDVETGPRWLARDEDRGKPAEHPIGVRHKGGVTLIQASIRNEGTCRLDAKGDVQAEDTARARVPMRGTGAETLVVGMKVL